ncbi:MAG: hypothetical protein QME66_08185 [Candidatus Eisenbacteria bacterium]|nr:hypothetical protein [Candidatus Eisenbacteria bacterium]
MEFDPIRHEYRMGGVLVPHVTGVLESERITDYSMIASDVLEAAKQRGDFVHRLTAMNDRDTLDPKSVDPTLVGYLEGWRLFRRDTQFVSTLIESRVYDPVYRYAGTLDRVGRFGDEPGTILLDIKTGPILNGAALQTAAYNRIVGADRRMGVRLTENGKYQLKIFEDENDEAVFLAALCLHNWRKNNG